MKTTKAGLQRYTSSSPYQAIKPSALSEFFFVPSTRDNETIGEVCVVRVDGPISNTDPFTDSYSAIRARLQEAFDGQCKAVVMCIESPGGDVQGAFECARWIRAAGELIGKPLYVHVEGQCCSAAYALASAANQIWMSDTALVGSIGVISSRLDVTAANAASGVRVLYSSSGRHKVFGHPDSPVTEEEAQEAQLLVDAMAQVFFALVSDHRPNISIDGVSALDGRLLMPGPAISAGLADNQDTFEALLGAINSGVITMASSYEKAVQALQQAAEGTDANAEAAKRALAALEVSVAPAAEDPEDDKPKAEGEEEVDNDGDAPAAPPKKKDDEEKVAARSTYSHVSAKTAGQILSANTDLEHRLASLEKQLEGEKRTALLASRPDVGKEMQALLATKSYAECEAILGAIKVRTKPAAITTAPVTAGDTQGGQPGLVGKDLEKIKAAMRGSTHVATVVNQGAQQLFSSAGRRK